MPQTNKTGRVWAVVIMAAVIGCAAEAQEIVVIRGGRTSAATQEHQPGARIIQIAPEAVRSAKLRVQQSRNPLANLLSDSTLRVGDVAMFPDGPRIFVGQEGVAHFLNDFRPVTTGTKLIPPALRGHVLTLRAGVNSAWAAIGTGTVQAATNTTRRGFEVVGPAN